MVLNNMSAGSTLSQFLRLSIAKLFISIFILSPMQSVDFVAALSHDVNTDPCLAETPESQPLRNIYCVGKILQTVNTLGIFNDSKDFVDGPLKFPPEVVIQHFGSVNVSSKQSVEAFYHENIDVPGKELIPCKSFDTKNHEDDEPTISSALSHGLQCDTFNDTIVDQAYRQFACDVANIWPVLCRRVNKTLKVNNTRSTMLYLPHEFIIPGGRFREAYYWDTYWIIKGLLDSNQSNLALSMLRNQKYLIDTYGFIPNGGRMYYLRRSQPPTYALSVYDYIKTLPKAKKPEIMAEFLPSIEKEFQFWELYRTVNVTVKGKEYKAFYYSGGSNQPRPESYKEDLHTASSLPESKRNELWQNIAAAAESGWDFSSRWLDDRLSLETSSNIHILPVDLNALLCRSAQILAEFFKRTAWITKQQDYYMNKYSQYRTVKTQLEDLMDNLLWSEEEGSYFDFWINKNSLRIEYYGSTVVPLFLQCGRAMERAPRIYQYLKKSGVFNYAHGIPTSLRETGQQWDYPNNWAPITHMMVRALQSTGDPEMLQTAYNVTEKWLKQVYAIYQIEGVIFEKYSVNDTFEPGQGGEYEVQTGFGWTNGIVLDLLILFGKNLTASDDSWKKLPGIASHFAKRPAGGYDRPEKDLAVIAGVETAEEVYIRKPFVRSSQGKEAIYSRHLFM